MALRPLSIEARTMVERFLRSHSGCGKCSVEIRTPDRFLFRKPFSEENGEATDESISGAAAVDRIHGKRRHVDSSLVSGEHRSVRAKCNDHPANAVGEHSAAHLQGSLRNFQGSIPLRARWGQSNQAHSMRVDRLVGRAQG
jgi:hypothetical protein